MPKPVVLKLYKLHRKETEWGLYNEIVVRASSCREARRLARTFASQLEDEDSRPGYWANQWLWPGCTECHEIKLITPAKVILGNFRAGRAGVLEHWHPPSC